MACALTPGADYPDYLKNILTEINSGNDNDLKACACSLKSPVTDEGCTILDEDGKIGAFPFCSTLVTDGVGDNTDYPLKLTLKQMMKLYWQTSTWAFSAESFSTSLGALCNDCRHTYSITQNRRSTSWYGTGNDLKIPPFKYLVCPSAFLYTAKSSGQTCCPPVPPNPPCIPMSNSEYAVAQMFSTATNQIKYKKEGDTYYFYPHFGITVGTYAVCTSTTENYAEECLSSAFGSRNGGGGSVMVKINGESTNAITLYTKIYTNTEFCTFNGNVVFNSLDFN